MVTGGASPRFGHLPVVFTITSARVCGVVLRHGIITSWNHVTHGLEGAPDFLCVCGGEQHLFCLRPLGECHKHCIGICSWWYVIDRFQTEIIADGCVFSLRGIPAGLIAVVRACCAFTIGIIADHFIDVKFSVNRCIKIEQSPPPPLSHHQKKDQQSCGTSTTHMVIMYTLRILNTSLLSPWYFIYVA